MTALENFRVLKSSVSHEWENAVPVHAILNEIIHFKSVILNLVHFGGSHIKCPACQVFILWLITVQITVKK